MIRLMGCGLEADSPQLHIPNQTNDPFMRRDLEIIVYQSVQMEDTLLDGE